MFLQSQRGAASVSSRPAEGQHLRPGAEGRHHHQTLARTAGEKPAGKPSHRHQGHPTRSTVTEPGVIVDTDSPFRMWAFPRMVLRQSSESRRKWRKFYLLLENVPVPRTWETRPEPVQKTVGMFWFWQKTSLLFPKLQNKIIITWEYLILNKQHFEKQLQTETSTENELLIN